MSSELPDLDEAISFAVDNGAQAGPFSMRSIVDSVKSGQRAQSVLVWWAGEPDWVPFNSVPGLVGLLQDPQPALEDLPPPPTGAPFGDAPIGAADATMTFGAAAAAEAVGEDVAASAAATDPVSEIQQITETAADEVGADTNVFAGVDQGMPGEVIEMPAGGGEIDATQTWAAEGVSEVVETGSDIVETEGGDFSWAQPEQTAAADVWADADQPAVTGEPESTDGGGLSTGLFGAGAGAAAAAGAAAGGVFSGGADAVEEAAADAGGMADAASAAFGEAMPDAGGVTDAAAGAVADLGGAADGAMDAAADAAADVAPDGFSPLASVNERIEALGAESPVPAEPEPVAAIEPEPVAAVVEEPVVADPVPSDPEPIIDPAVAARTALFGQLLDSSAAVEGEQLRADRKVVVMLGGVMNAAAQRGLALLDMVSTGLQHSARFENPADGTRTTVALGNAGDHVRMAFGYGTKVEDPESVLTSSAWDDGPIMIGADTDDGYAFTGVDLFVDAADYVADDHTVNADAMGDMFDAITQELRNSLDSGLG